LSINVHGYDAAKRGAMGLVSDAKVALEKISRALGSTRFADPDFAARDAWFATVDGLTTLPASNQLPTDAQVIGAVQRNTGASSVVMSAAGTMPGALHTLLRTAKGGYHMEYGFSCMGYEIAGAMGVKLARPEADVICMVGDGSYMMANSELATAVMMGVPFTVILTDNRGFGCINRLQKATGGAPFNNLLDDSYHVNAANIDFVAHAGSMGAHVVKAASVPELETAMQAAKSAKIPTVIVIDTDPMPGTGGGGSWWEVAVPEVSVRPEVNAARTAFAKGAAKQALVR
jgi:3D-(3,5/4)-trihydroxycyclohexane-1,2-dione acylhydrolase (decyclizing)